MLSSEKQEELQWWLDHLTAWNGKMIIAEKPPVVIRPNASTRGWGATCERVRMGRLGSPEKSYSGT